MPITRSQLLKELEPGLHALFGLSYARYENQHLALFEVESSDRAFEEETMLVGFGEAPFKNEGGSVSFDEAQEAWTARYTHSTVALAYSITEEAIEDNLYDKLSARYTKALARSMSYSLQVNAAAVYNNAFSSSFLGGDAVALLATNHPLTIGGTYSNTSATNADISEQAFEDAIIAIQGFVDERGIPVALNVKSLIIPKEQTFAVRRLLGSEFRVSTGDNDINALKSMGLIPEVHVNNFLTDTLSWYLRTDVEDGMKMFDRVPVSTKMDADFESGNAKFKARQRYSFGWSDPRALWGSQGT